MSGAEPYLLAAAVAMSAVSTVQTGRHRAAMSQHNAAQAERQARSISEQARFAEAQHRRRLRRTLSSQRAAIASSGVALSGSPLLALEETAAEGELDALAIRYSSELGQADARAQAAADRMQARAFRSGGYMSAASQLLYGGAKLGAGGGFGGGGGGGTVHNSGYWGR